MPKNQASDAAQKGPGVKTGSCGTPTAPSAPSPGKHAGNPSGQPNSSTRGKQG